MRRGTLFPVEAPFGRKFVRPDNGGLFRFRGRYSLQDRSLLVTEVSNEAAAFSVGDRTAQEQHQYAQET